MSITTYVRLAPQDQRLCIKGDRFYIFDNSGATPWNTDDGPLVLLTDRPIELDDKVAYARVVKEEGMDDSVYTVGMGHDAALKLYQVLKEHGVELRFEHSFKASTLELLKLCVK